jgi:hypothetical protein
MDPQEWTYWQRGAAVALVQMFKSLEVFRVNYQRIAAVQMSTFIYLVGRVFFLDSLSNVKFVWYDDANNWPFPRTS